MGGSLLAVARRHQEQLVVGTAGLVLVGVTLLPLLVLALGVGIGLDPAEPHLALRVGDLMLRSLGIASAVTTVALVIGVPLGVVLTNADVPGRRSILVLHAFPMCVPPFLLALGWFHLLGRHGLLGTETTARLLFGPAGAVFVLSLAFTPVVTCLTALGLRAIDPALVEAACVVARPWRVTTRILLPLARPAVALAALIVFALAFSELGVPMFLRVPAYPGAVFARLGGLQYAPGEAFALVFPLLGVAVVLLALERRLVYARSFGVIGLRGGERAALLAGRWRKLAAALCALVAALSVLPLLVLALRAGPAGFAAAPSWLGSSIGNSVLSASVAATLITLLGLVLGSSLARGRPGSSVLDAVAALGFLTPAAPLGVGLITLWNHPATQAVYGSVAIVIVGYVARYALVGERTIAAAIAQSSPHLEDASAAFGAGYIRRLLRIVLPIHARGVTAAWGLALVFCLRDLETAALLYPPGGEPLPVRIMTLEANGPEPVVAALAVVHVLMTALVVASGLLVLRGWRR